MDRIQFQKRFAKVFKDVEAVKEITFRHNEVQNTAFIKTMSDTSVMFWNHVEGDAVYMAVQNNDGTIGHTSRAEALEIPV